MTSADWAAPFGAVNVTVVIATAVVVTSAREPAVTDRTLAAAATTARQSDRSAASGPQFTETVTASPAVGETWASEGVAVGVAVGVDVVHPTSSNTAHWASTERIIGPPTLEMGRRFLSCRCPSIVSDLQSAFENVT